MSHLRLGGRAVAVGLLLAAAKLRRAAVGARLEEHVLRAATHTLAEELLEDLSRVGVYVKSIFVKTPKTESLKTK